MLRPAGGRSVRRLQRSPRESLANYDGPGDWKLNSFKDSESSPGAKVRDGFLKGCVLKLSLRPSE